MDIEKPHTSLSGPSPTKKTLESVDFDIYGVTLRVESEDPQVLNELERDFTYFKVSRTPIGQYHVHLTCINKPADFSLPPLTSKSISSRCVVYQQGEEKWISYYGGRALLNWNLATEKGTLYCSEGPLLHELCYLTLLSRMGEHLDEKKMHRLHAAALSFREKALLFLLPSGGGKTTLALSLLTEPEFSLLSDDMPLIDRSGLVWSFPNRIGVCDPTETSAISPKYIRPFFREEHGTKWVIDPKAFSDRLVSSTAPGYLFVGKRKLSGETKIYRISQFKAWKELFVNGVIGVGLPQVIELFLNHTWKDIWVKAKTVFSRSRNMIALLNRSETFCIELSNDKQENLNCLLKMLKRHNPLSQ